VKYLYILVLIDVLKHLITAPFMSGLWVLWKFIPLCSRYCCTVALTNSVPLSDCMVIGFLFWNNDFKADATEVAVLSFRCTLQAHQEYTSMIFKSYLYLSLYLFGNLYLQYPTHVHHQYLLQYTDCEGFFFAHVCAECMCSGLKTTLPHPVSYFHGTLLTMLLNRTILGV